MKKMKKLAAFFLSLLLTSPAWADSTINALSAGAALGGTEQIPMFQTSNPAVTTTPNAVKTFLTGATNTWSAVNTFSASNGIVYSGAAVGTQVACLGLDASNNVVKNAAACGSGGGTPAGPSSAVQFNNAGAFGGDASFEFVVPGQVTLALGAITTNLKALNITGTFNGAAVTFDAPLFMNITNTASQLNSALVDIQINGASVFGIYTFSNNSGAVYLSLAGGTLHQIWSPASYVTNIGGNVGGAFATIGVNSMGAGRGITTRGDSWFGFTNSNDSFTGAFDTAIVRQGAAGVVGIHNGQTLTAAAALQIYNTSDVGAGTPTNYERAVMDWTTTANTLSIGSQSNGTGVARPVLLVSSGMFAATGPALPACNTTAVANYPNGTKGFQAVVSDATAPTYNATYTSGGAVVAHVVCNGTNWVTQ